MVDETLSKHERENLLIKLDKEFAFAGATIPAYLEVGDERIPLRALVFEMSKKRGRLTSEEIGAVDRLIPLIRRRRREIVALLSREEMARSKAGELYEEALGLDRALDTLYNVPLPKLSINDEANKAKMEDGRRWLNLVRKVYSGEEKRKRD
ncbi:MAG TPA: DUF5788 family protein [Methanocella sp.]|uniref:DUF5788 family protein n=1 Tax=Methanocella sp. TaxID=2052833 RepID=UPI002C750240|nr:DUF5788 family protein [Methanocella sp.]HTY92129.1 DUF5788 family protein [Methanocella sp.]